MDKVALESFSKEIAKEANILAKLLSAAKTLKKAPSVAKQTVKAAPKRTAAYGAVAGYGATKPKGVLSRLGKGIEDASMWAGPLVAGVGRTLGRSLGRAESTGKNLFSAATKPGKFNFKKFVESGKRELPNIPKNLFKQNKENLEQFGRGAVWGMLD